MALLQQGADLKVGPYDSVCLKVAPCDGDAPGKAKGHHPLRDDGLLETWKLFWLHHPQTPARASANSTDDMIVRGLR